MVSNNQRKQILQLKQKKYRLSSGYFVAEGEKVVEEILSASWECVFLFLSDSDILINQMLVPP